MKDKLIAWWKDFIFEEYEVKVWYEDPKKYSLYNLKKITKLSPTVLKGVDIDGVTIEMVVQNKFNYQVRKIH
jgi:hypothetical protein